MNASYKTSVNQAPREHTPGELGKELNLRLRLKVVADVGLLGLPNAGKSTFLSVVSAARPKIADYPFTTLKPQLGVVRGGEGEMVIADLPGLIEGAAQGIGLGHDFLKHLSRCAAVLHLLDATQPEPWTAYKTIRKEVKNYDADYGTSMSTLPEVVVLTKTDALTPEDAAAILKTTCTKLKRKDILAMSAIAGDGVPEVLKALGTMVDAKKNMS
jgi:GTP-binding protein